MYVEGESAAGQEPANSKNAPMDGSRKYLLVPSCSLPDSFELFECPSAVANRVATTFSCHRDCRKSFRFYTPLARIAHRIPIMKSGELSRLENGHYFAVLSSPISELGLLPHGPYFSSEPSFFMSSTFAMSMTCWFVYSFPEIWSSSP